MIPIGAVLLAAGESRRFGNENKLLSNINGLPMLQAVAKAVVDSGRFAELIVVTGYDSLSIRRTVGKLPLTFVHNAEWRRGMGSSIAAGVGGLSEHVRGAAIFPGDMPFVTRDLLEQLARKFEEFDGAAIVFPATREGRQRNPVIWPRSFFGGLCALDGHEGGKSVLKGTAEHSVSVVVEDGTQLQDVDEPIVR